MKDIGEIEKIEKYSQKSVRIVYNLYVSVCVCVIFAYYCVWTCERLSPGYMRRDV